MFGTCPFPRVDVRRASPIKRRGENFSTMDEDRRRMNGVAGNKLNPCRVCVSVWVWVSGKLRYKRGKSGRWMEWESAHTHTCTHTLMQKGQKGCGMCVFASLCQKVERHVIGTVRKCHFSVCTLNERWHGSSSISGERKFERAWKSGGGVQHSQVRIVRIWAIVFFTILIILERWVYFDFISVKTVKIFLNTWKYHFLPYRIPHSMTFVEVW